MRVRRALAALAVTALILGLTPGWAIASTSGWLRNHAAPGPTFHCNTYYDVVNGLNAAYVQVCVVVSGHTWQPVVIYSNQNLWFPDVLAPVNLYRATNANPGVWYLEGNCGVAIDVDNAEITMCFGPSRVQPSTLVQAKVASLEAITEGNDWTVGPAYSPSVTTGP